MYFTQTYLDLFYDIHEPLADFRTIRQSISLENLRYYVQNSRQVLIVFPQNLWIVSKIKANLRNNLSLGMYIEQHNHQQNTGNLYLFIK